MKLTDKQRVVMTKDHIEGVCIRYRWTWLIDGEPVTRQVQTLLERGLMRAAYYSGGKASASVTDLGRVALGD
jgi:hypothetical protein